jgi:Amt family ammonium transporter
MDSGDTAFILVSTALVALMTPGLAFFYGGLVGRKNVLTVMMQSFIAMGLVSVLWMVVGFSLAFGTDIGGVIGGMDYFMMQGVGLEVMEGLTIPTLAFFAFQMMFAVITPALITGAFVDRMTFKSYLVFLSVWSLAVYAPLCHWVWGGGFIGGLGALDFAGGTVVHISAGMAALAAVFALGNRKNTEHAPHNIPFIALGTALLWFGWYGFNGGSALAANGQAAAALANTEVAASVAMVTWLALSWVVDKKPSVVGALTGVLAGLVAITPAAGFVTLTGALAIGAIASVVSFYAVKFRQRMNWDDALDVWGVHGMAGVAGSILTGVFAVTAIGGAPGLIEGSVSQFLANVYATGIAIVFAFVATYAILKVMGLFMQVRVDEAHEDVGIDGLLHGEFAYDNAFDRAHSAPSFTEQKAVPTEEGELESVN